MSKSLWAPMRMVLNTTVVEALSLRDLSAEGWRVIAYRGFDHDDWSYAATFEVEAYKTLRHLGMFVLTQRREEEQFVLLAKVANASERAWPGALKNELNKVRRKP